MTSAGTSTGTTPGGAAGTDRAAPRGRTRWWRRGLDLDARLEALDEALRLAEGRLDDESLRRARAVRERAAQRLATAPDWLVVALAGGTGSGKSSLFNALAGRPLAAVGARRPVTSGPQAWVVSEPEDGAAPGQPGGRYRDSERLLDWLGVDARTYADEPAELSGLVLVDLPDHDSVVGQHRVVVDRFVERVDVLVWVVDPMKYAQRTLHEDYLRRLTTHARVLLVALNRVDELSAEDRERCVADLRRLLDGAGLDATALFATSARSGEGVEALRRRLVEEVRRRQATAERIAADVDAVAGELQERCLALTHARVPALVPALAPAAPEGAVISALAGAVGVPARAAAAGERYRLTAISRSRSLASRAWRRFVQRGRVAVAVERAPDPPLPSAAQVTSAVLAAVADAKAGLPHPWPTVLHDVGQRAGERVRQSLGRAVAEVEVEAVRARWWWVVFGAARSLLAAVALVGFLWLGVLFGALYLQLPEPPTPQVGPLALPTVLLLGGLAGGLLVALLVRGLAALAGRRHARRVSRALRRRVAEVAQRELLDPLRHERDTHDELSAALQRARGLRAR